MNRYQRQIIIPGWGEKTQEKLRRAKVLVAGVGGLGCPVALNLVLAGIGHVRICDSDKVDITNLNRQFLHFERDLGQNKVDSAYPTLASINSETVVQPIHSEITADSVDEIVGDSQVILDCMDNFPARRALNECSVRKGIPLIHGAIWGFEGRVTFLHPPKTPCLHCIFPTNMPSRGAIPVVGGVSCTMGSLQALEAIKYLGRLGGLLANRMLILDCQGMHFQELEVTRTPQCPVCGHLEG